MKTDSLSERIDKVVREHLTQGKKEGDRGPRTSLRKVEDNSAIEDRARSMHRDPALVAELVGRLHKRTMAEPGEPMMRHADQLGTGGRRLLRWIRVGLHRPGSTGDTEPW